MTCCCNKAITPNAPKLIPSSPPARPSIPSEILTALPVATTANANNGTINQPIFTSPTNGTWKLATPSLAKKKQPSTTPINVISANFTGLRRPAAPPPKPRRLIMSSISPTIPPPTNAARGSQVCARSKLKKIVTTKIEITPITPAIVGMFRRNFAAWNLAKTFSFFPSVLSDLWRFQKRYR